MVSILGVLLVGLAPAGVTSDSCCQPPAPKAADEARAKLLTAQRGLNLVRDTIKMVSGLGGEQGRRLEQLKRLEETFLSQIEKLGGKPDPAAGSPPVDRARVSLELIEQMRTLTLDSCRRDLASVREAIRHVEAGDGKYKAGNLEALRAEEALCLQRIEKVERGHLVLVTPERPVMPVVPRKEVRRDID